jgi:hypothetical protein
MTRDFRHRLVPALLISATLALPACNGISSSAVPPGADAGTLNSVAAGERITAVGAQPDATCPKQYYNCYTFSLSKGLTIHWCYGTTSDPCNETSKFKWSGGVCLASNKSCVPPHPFLKSFVVKWTGPFNCKSTCKGTYEVDKLTKGSPAPKKTTGYGFKQDIHICPKSGGKCADAHVGIKVSS